LERPARGTGSQSDIPPSDLLVDKKTESKHSKDSLTGKEKETEEIKKEKESDRKTVLTGIENVDTKKLKSELMERLEEKRSVIQREISDVKTRNNKGNYEKRSAEFPEDLPEIIKRQRKPITGELDVAVPASLSWRTSTESEKSLKASLQFSLCKRRGSSGERDSGVSDGSFSDGKQSFTSPLLLHEDDSLLHGSSELMLVLLPETRNMRSEKGNDDGDDYDDNNINYNNIMSMITMIMITILTTGIIIKEQVGVGLLMCVIQGGIISAYNYVEYTLKEQTIRQVPKTYSMQRGKRKLVTSSHRMWPIRSTGCIEIITPMTIYFKLQVFVTSCLGNKFYWNKEIITYRIN
jgi:hypothetical protein